MGIKSKKLPASSCDSFKQEKAPKAGMCLSPEECSGAMRLLSDPCRIRIVRALFNGRNNVGEIAKLTGIDTHRVSHHLGIMRLSGLVEARRSGRNVVYNVSERVLGKGGLDLGCCSIAFRALQE
jgi:DNA-binding MarR family transcriptional regulator